MVIKEASSIWLFKRLGDFQVDQEIYNTVELQSFYRVMYSQKVKALEGET